jgi:hypothetical protein
MVRRLEGELVLPFSQPLLRLFFAHFLLLHIQVPFSPDIRSGYYLLYILG